MSYRYLSAEDQAAIIEEVRASVPTAEVVVRAAEAAHFRAVVQAKMGLGDMPDPFVAPDVTVETRAHADLDAAEVVKRG